MEPYCVWLGGVVFIDMKSILALFYFQVRGFQVRLIILLLPMFLLSCGAPLMPDVATGYLDGKNYVIEANWSLLPLIVINGETVLKERPYVAPLSDDPNCIGFLPEICTYFGSYKGQPVKIVSTYGVKNLGWGKYQYYDVYLKEKLLQRVHII